MAKKKVVRKKTVRKKSFAKKNILDESVEYIRDTKYHILAIIVLFFLSSIIAFFSPESFVFFDPIIEELAGQIDGMSTAGLIWFIFQNNLTSAFVGMLFGVLIGVFPVINALTNGSLLGYVYSKASAIGGLGVIWLLVPHGIFELPAIFIALGLGLRFGLFVLAPNRREEFVKRLYGSMKSFMTVVLPLLIIAAIIEGILIASG